MSCCKPRPDGLDHRTRRRRGLHDRSGRLAHGRGADPGSHDVLSCSIAWGEGATGATAISAGQCTGTHTYATTGAKTITVTISDDDGGSAVAMVAITITDQPNLPPTADAGADRSGTEGSPVTLNGSGSDPKGAPLTYAWTYAAGAAVDPGATCSFGSPTAATTTFTCTDDGSYAATLSVSDGATRPRPTPPWWSWQTPIRPCSSRRRVPTRHTPSVTPPRSRPRLGTRARTMPGPAPSPRGDSTTTVGVMADGACTGQHAYASPGPRTITVTVTDDDGGTGSDSVVVTVSAVVTQPPTADAGPDRTGTEGSAVSLSGSGSRLPDGHALSYHWSFDKGTGVDSGADCTFGSAQLGRDDLPLHRRRDLHRHPDGGRRRRGPGTDTAKVTLANAAPTTSITTPTAGSEFAIGATVSVSATVSDAGGNDSHTCSVAWGDGATGNGGLAAGACSATHTYSGSGARTITVMVTDDDGDSGSDWVGIVIAAAPVNQPPTADAGADKTSIEGSPAHLSGSGSDPEGAPLTYHWTSAPISGTDSGADCTFAAATSAATDVTCTDDGTFAVTLTVDDGTNPPVSDTAALVVTNADPTVRVTGPGLRRRVPQRGNGFHCRDHRRPGQQRYAHLHDRLGRRQHDDREALAAGVCTGSHAYSSVGARTVARHGERRRRGLRLRHRRHRGLDDERQPAAEGQRRS